MGYCSQAGCRWCGWCCTLKADLCCSCNLCSDCCRCPPPCCPPFPCFPCMPPLPCLGPCPPPTRVIHEQCLVPIAYPFPCPPPHPFSIHRNRPVCGGWDQQAARASCCDSEFDCCGPTADPETCNPFAMQNCRPWPCRPGKRIYKCNEPLIPGYSGHIPGYWRYSAGRSFGSATKDTCCIMSKWNETNPELPCRIFEQ